MGLLQKRGGKGGMWGGLIFNSIRLKKKCFEVSHIEKGKRGGVKIENMPFRDQRKKPAFVQGAKKV